MIAIHCEIGNKEELLQDHYKFLYNGILTNWDLDVTTGEIYGNRNCQSALFMEID